MDTSLSNFFLSAVFMLMFSVMNSVGFTLTVEPICGPTHPPDAVAIYPDDVHLLRFSLNLEYLLAEFYLYGALGCGLDKVAPELVMGGPPPIGAQEANLDKLVSRIIEEFGYQQVGHIRAIKTTVGGFPRPLVDLSASIFAKIMNNAFGYPLDPPFDPYANSLNFMLAAYVIPYYGINTYVGANPFIKGWKTKRLLAGLLGVAAGQDAVIRKYLYERADYKVYPYDHTVAKFTERISALSNALGMCGIKDEGIRVPPYLGAENRTTSNVLSADYNSLSYARTPREVLRIVYATGSEHVPGGFFPKGENGKIARELLYHYQS
ncbi:hypothetical protein C5167_007114 [Papaver somniferum]|uniref:Desiccation-related protein PCC13-62 n=1 Tax=Papaver somniferum TaxID=3469 RepID=A0A4Y7JG94_PAPSO|nr:desiccation-related protein PCC13-62-like [Papaver somniferum]RZC59817.1 hypothetical protein C5167_007114 [Papaver somniferum]